MVSSDAVSRTLPEVEEKAVGTQIENVKTFERVPGHPGYYEKDGLRTYGDNEDHDHEPPVRWALNFIRTGADNAADDD